MGFAEVLKEAGDAVGYPLVAFTLAIPAAVLGGRDQLPYDAEALPQPGRVLRCGDELRAARVGVTLPGTSRGETHAAAEFEELARELEGVPTFLPGLRSPANSVTHGPAMRWGNGLYRPKSRCSMSVKRTYSREPARRPPSWK